MTTILCIVSVALALLAAALTALLMAGRRETARLAAEKAAAEEARDKTRAALDALAAQHLETEKELAAARASAAAELAALREKSAEQREAERTERKRMEETLRLQFRDLAGEVLGEQSRQFKQTNKEALDILLKPFRDNIADFRERVERIYSHENEQRGYLKNELRNLMELNRKITAETTNLTNALKGNSKVQGDWGEVILETILDNSNLIRGVHYDTQLNVKDAEGNNLRPDVVLYLPGGKQIVIDSKVSLTAYVNYVSAGTDAERRAAMTAHVASVRQHVSELGRKEYQRLMQSPDFVIMFVPNEPAFLAALQADSAIWGDAYEKKVIVSSPTNLFALLKLVDDLWRRDDQSRNQENIIKYGVALYEQLVAFSAALEGVGQNLDQARAKYDEAYKRLHTGKNNIVRTGERLRKLGLPTAKRQSQRLLDETEGLDDDAADAITDKNSGDE